jgi:phosphatidate cytidylyltransferase
MGAAVLALLWWAPAILSWAALTALAALAQTEFYNMVNGAGVPAFRRVGVGCGAALIAATFFTIGPDAVRVAASYRWEQLALLGSLMAVFIRQFPQKDNDQPLTTIACTLLGIWYVPLLLDFFTRLAFVWDRGGLLDPMGPTGRAMVLYLLLVVKCTDMGAYLLGTRLGRHKLLPRISPAKTWEGLISGLACGVAVSIAFVGLSGWRLGTVGVGPAHAAVLGLVLGGIGSLGDLFESMLKRASGAKDSGRLIPGMGGILDVLDSLLFGAPALYVYTRIVLP